MTPSLPVARAWVVALTGGIAAGKSAAQAAFAGHGVPIFDADVVARELVAPGEPALAQIAADFGSTMLDAQGGLDRRRMRERVFADADARRRLEAILHPRIRARLQADATACTAPYCLLAIPLLAESWHAYGWVDRVAVVDVPVTVQIARLLQRDGVDAQAAQQAVAAQASRSARLAIGNDVIDNTASLAALAAAVVRLHRLYGDLAARRAR